MLGFDKQKAGLSLISRHNLNVRSPKLELKVKGHVLDDTEPLCWTAKA